MSVQRDRDAWRVRWRANGKQRSRTFATQEAAHAFDAEVKNRRQEAGAYADLRWVSSGGEQVYIIIGADKLKIGCSREPALRLTQLQTGSPVTLSIAWRIACPDGRRLEAALHRRYAKHHSYGEWFHAAPVLADLLNLQSLDLAELEGELGL